MLCFKGEWIEALLGGSWVSVNVLWPGREVAAAALNVRVVLGLHLIVFNLLIDAFLCQFVPLLWD